jgi:arabinose-5-phosphate isomerase
LISSKSKGILSNHVLSVFIVPVKEELESCFSTIPTNSISNYITYFNILISIIIEKNNISNNIYKENHKSGNIGKLLLSVKDLMISPDNYPILNHNNTIKEALILMNKKRKGITIILNDLDNIIGIITDGDIRRYIEKNDDLNVEVINITNKNYYNINNINMKLMDIDLKYNFIPIVIDSKFIGMIEK